MTAYTVDVHVCPLHLLLFATSRPKKDGDLCLPRTWHRSNWNICL